MTSQKLLLARLARLASVALICSMTSAFAADRMPFNQKSFADAQAAGKSILVDVSAPWCPTCRAQKPIIEQLSQLPEYKTLVIFDVDFDTQEDALHSLKAQQQSTLIAFKGDAETGRSVGSTQRGEISALFKKTQ